MHQDLDMWDQELQMMCQQMTDGIAQLKGGSVALHASMHFSCHTIWSLDMLCRSTGYDSCQFPPANLNLNNVKCQITYQCNMGIHKWLLKAQSDMRCVQ